MLTTVDKFKVYSFLTFDEFRKLNIFLTLGNH